jgi:phosphomevalonate kinase
MVVRAPGKVMLCGEYAVLAGAPAIVAAVDRYARARPVEQPAAGASAFVRQAVRRAAWHARRLAPSLPPPVHIAVETDGFRRRGDKLGIGSSAAATVAAAGAVLAAVGIDLEAPATRRDLLAMATAAHRDAQGQAGSGADVAASVHGGVIRFQPAVGGGRAVEPVSLPRGLLLTFFWTGRAAHTPTLVEQVEAGGCSLEPLAELARAFADRFGAGDARGVIEIARLYGAAMRRLGEDAGVPIVSREHALLMELARRLGGAAKPSGAGGGDLGVALLVDPQAASALREGALELGLIPVELGLDRGGVRLEHVS